MKENNHQHCWHANGTLITDGMAQNGTTDCQCCECGTREAIAWRTKTRRIAGHGPHVSSTGAAYDEPVYGEASR